MSVDVDARWGRNPPLDPELLQVLEHQTDGCAVCLALRGEQGEVEDFGIEYFNAAARRDPPDFARVGHRLRDVLPAPVAATLLETCRRVVETGEPFESPDFPYRVASGTAAGKAARIHLRVTRLGDGIVATWRETDQHGRESREATREAVASTPVPLDAPSPFRDLLDAAPAVLWTTDSQHYCTLLSRGWCEFTGQAEAQGLGFGWIEAVHPDDRPRAEETFLAAAERREPFWMDYRLRRADGQYRWATDSGRPRFSEAGKFLGYAGSVIDVHERKMAEEALRESWGRFRAMSDDLPLIVWLHGPDGRQEFVNKTFCDYFGVSREEMREGRWQLLTHPDDGSTYTDHFFRCIRERQPFHEVVRARRADGEWRWLESWGHPRFGREGEYLGHVGTSLDITERRRAQEQLRQSEEWFRTLADNIHQLVWMADATGWIFWYNKRWFDYTGTTFKEMRGWGWKKVHHPEHVERVVERLQRSWDTGQPWEDTFPLRGKDGQYRWFLSRALPIHDADGHVVRWFGTNTDITGQRQAEQSLRELNEQLEERVADRTSELRRNNARLQQLALELTRAEQRERAELSSTLHDGLQQLLVAMKMQIPLLRLPSGELDKELQHRLEQLADESIAITRSLSCELSPPELLTGRFENALEWLVRWFQENHRHRVHLRTTADFPPLGGDIKALTYSIVRELLLNSVKHSGVHETHVRLLPSENGMARIEVLDEGRGFTPAQVSGASGEPTGLGLAGIRRRLTAIGGRLQLDAAPAAGARFLVELPAD